ncbi:MAG: protein kinase [Phycisphaerae bacterium]
METSQKQNADRSPEERIAVVCPQCRQRYKIAARLLGKRLMCKKCRHEWRSNASQSDPSTDSGPVRPTHAIQNDTPSDSGQVGLDVDLPPTAGSSSIAIDMSWAGKHIGRYRARSLLGYGGMGVVWRAHDDSLRRDVALKILSRKREETSRSGINMDLFMQEARAVAKLQHPSVVSIYEVAEDQGHVFLSLELMEGGTLKEYVERNGPIPPRRLFNWMIGPAKALSLAHRKGVIHRDVKPGNLMFDDHGHLKLMDFGLAQVSNERISEKLRGKAVGSLGWVAPETARGQGTTERSDLYGMGLVMLYALTGKPFIHAKSRSAIIALHQNPPEVKLDAIPGLTAMGERLLRRCLAVDQAERIATADALAEALQACAEEDPTARKRKRKEGVSIAVAAAVIGAIGGIYVSFYYFLDMVNRQDEFSRPVAMAGSPVNTASRKKVIDRDTRVARSDRVVGQGDQDASLQRPWPEVRDGKDLKFIGSKNKNKLHLPTRSCGRDIFASNLVTYETIKQAVHAHRKPCPRCFPNGFPKTPEHLVVVPESE